MRFPRPALLLIDESHEEILDRAVKCESAAGNMKRLVESGSRKELFEW